MKRTFSILIVLIICGAILSAFSCKKSKSDSGCGCDTNSSNRYAAYNNFGGFEYEATLNYKRENNLNAWFIGVRIIEPNYTNNAAVLKICNPNLPAIKSITDTSSRKYPIPVKFAGYLKDICSGEDQTFGFTVLPETICAYITIDSLIKK